MQVLPDKDLPFERFMDSLGEACLLVTPQGQILATNSAAETHYGVDEQSLLGRTLTDMDSDGERDLRLHHLMLESALDGVIAHTMDGELLYANRAAQNQWGMTLDAARARGPWGWIAHSKRDESAKRLKALVEHGSARFESRMGENGDHKCFEVSAQVVDGPDGKIIVSTVRDISQRLETEEMVRYLAYHDGLTGLANRVLLQQELFHQISIAERHDDILGVAFIDLDSFKPVNDTYGHAIGDDVLREVADRISGCVREGDTVARVGGDEFVIVLPRLAGPEALEAVAAKLCDEVSRPIPVNGTTIRVTASIGTALHRKGDDAEALLTRADLGMYESRGVCLDGTEMERAE